MDLPEIKYLLIMNKAIIETNAGSIYQLLSERVHWNYEELKKETRMSDQDLCVALGWLARENKVEFEPTPNSFKVFLNINYYF